MFACCTLLFFAVVYFIVREWVSKTGCKFRTPFPRRQRRGAVRLGSSSSSSDSALPDTEVLRPLRGWGDGRWVFSSNPMYASFRAAVERAARPLPDIPLVPSITLEEECLVYDDHIYSVIDVETAV